MNDAAYLMEQAKRCRRLAAGVNDPHTVKTLKRMADDFERRAGEIANTIPQPIPR